MSATIAPKPARSRGQGKTGRAPRVKLKISISTEAYDGLSAKARARGMTIEGLIGEMLERIAADDILSARIDPTRVSQIRIIFLDPDARPGKGGGSFVSAIGAWDFIVGDLIGEILGGGDDDDLSLAARYEQTKIPSMYVYFSSDTRTYTTAPGFLKTQTVKLG